MLDSKRLPAEAYETELAAMDATTDAIAVEKCEKCEHCDSIETTLAPDPYLVDIHDDDTPIWLCQQCRDDRRDET